MHRIPWSPLLLLLLVVLLGSGPGGMRDAADAPAGAAMGAAAHANHTVWLPVLPPVTSDTLSLSSYAAIRREPQPTVALIAATATPVPTATSSPPSPTPVVPTVTALPPRALPPVTRTDGSGNLAHAGELDVRGGPSLTAAQVDAILAGVGSPATGTGDVFTAYSRASGIDNAIALAFFFQESSAGTAGVHMPFTHNIGNIVCAGYPTCHGRWRSYPSWEHGIADWYRLIAVEYIQQRGTVTVEQILPIYAPAFENNVPRYIANVRRWVAQWRGQPLPALVPTESARVVSAPTPVPPLPTPESAPEPPVSGAIAMPDLVGHDQTAARERLAALGITTIITDVQGREHLGTVFDQAAPETVVSSQPAPGAWVLPGEPVVLGVRGPAAPVVVAGPGDGVVQPLPTPILLPDLVGLPLATARVVLRDHGLSCVLIDMQGRDHLGDPFEQTDPETVVSSQPPAATLVDATTVVVLGVRAPDRPQVVAAPGDVAPEQDVLPAGCSAADTQESLRTDRPKGDEP